MRLLIRLIPIVVFSVGCQCLAQTTSPSSEQLDFGREGLSFQAPVRVNGHVPRTAELLGEAYRRGEPLVWKRVQLVSDLGQVGVPAAAPYLAEAMRDPTPAV